MQRHPQEKWLFDSLGTLRHVACRSVLPHWKDEADIVFTATQAEIFANFLHQAECVLKKTQQDNVEVISVHDNEK